jgi:hypothetical protein
MRIKVPETPGSIVAIGQAWLEQANSGQGCLIFLCQLQEPAGQTEPGQSSTDNDKVILIVGRSALARMFRLGLN